MGVSDADESTVGTPRCEYPGCTYRAVARIPEMKIVGEGVGNDEALCQSHAKQRHREGADAR